MLAVRFPARQRGHFLICGSTHFMTIKDRAAIVTMNYSSIKMHGGLSRPAEAIETVRRTQRVVKSPFCSFDHGSVQNGPVVGEPLAGLQGEVRRSSGRPGDAKTR